MIRWFFRCLWLALLTFPAWAEPLVLVVGDLNQVQVSLLESRLREQLRQLRDQGQLQARLASYNVSLANHRNSLEKLQVDTAQLPLLLVCEQTSEGLPQRVEWSQVVTQPERSVREMMEFLQPGGGPPELPPGGDLVVHPPRISVGSMLGVINVKVRFQNQASTTLQGPLTVQVWTRPPGGEWHLHGEQVQDKVPAGWSVTKDFFLQDAAHLLDGPFEARGVVSKAGVVLQEEVSRFEPSAPAP